MIPLSRMQGIVTQKRITTTRDIFKCFDLIFFLQKNL